MSDDHDVFFHNYNNNKRDTWVTIMVMPISNFTDILHTELVKLLKNSNNTGGWGEFVCMRLCENN